jgi:phosphoribosylaminoimidazole-succinocarboxamide synthase
VPTASAYLRSGKVRDLFAVGDDRILLVASDRISAFDVVLPTEIPDKGRVLTGLSRHWFAETAGIVANHLLSTDPAALPDDWTADPADAQELADLRGRMMLCRRADVVPIEAVVRGYVAGSGWKEYRADGTICQIRLPAGLRESDRLPEPIFTPATKAPIGEHDENIGFDEMVGRIGGPLAERIRDVSLALYRHGAAQAATAGIILADTKFEFGLDPASGELLLIDEVLTPDSSRFWDAASYAPGGPQASYDKQFVRDWLETQPWDKSDPGPELPVDVVRGTRERYIEAYERITAASFERYLADDVVGP